MRDARIHPMIGDRLKTKSGWRKVVGVTGRAVTFDACSYTSPMIARRSIFIRAWRKWAKSATVIEPLKN